jgi:hypothetical protein
MVAKSKSKGKKNNSPRNPDSASACAVPAPSSRTISNQMKFKLMFRGLNTKPEAVSTSNSSEEEDDKILRDDCKAELNRNMRDANKGACPLHNESESFNDPLKWWSLSASKYTLVADLARVFLAIPATSAPSERIWSRAARILTLRRAKLKDEVVSRMMFVKENSCFLHKHYCALAKQEMEPHLHHLAELELKYLPPLKEQEEEAPLDVGIDDCEQDI